MGKKDIISRIHTRRNIISTALVAVAGSALPFGGRAFAETTLQKIKRTGIMTVGTSAAYAPFEYVADGKIIGYDVDLGEAVAKRMNVKAEWQDIDFKGIVAALKSGRVACFSPRLPKPRSARSRSASAISIMMPASVPQSRLAPRSPTQKT